MNDAELPSVGRIAELQQFITKFAKVERAVNLTDTGRPENDVEHSYGLALTCWYLAPKIAPNLNIAKIFAYAIAHDTVEVYAGDTFLFGDPELLAMKSDREDAAIESLKEDWSDFPDLSEAAAGYKSKQDEEARFVYAIDKILPVLMVNLGEKDEFWHRHKITKSIHDDAKKTILASDYVAPYYEKLLAWTNEPNHFYHES